MDTMVGGITAFLFLSTLAVIQNLKVPDNIPLIEAEPGQTVIITCNGSGLENGLFFWYKMICGYMIQTVAKGSFGNVKLGKDVPYSKIHVENNGDMHSLIVRNVSKEDEGIYFCQGGPAYDLRFVNGTNVVVNEPQNQKLTYVNQTSDMNSVLLGATVTLQCSLLSEKKERTNQCADEHDVFWFRAESESNPGFIYADKKRCSKRAGRSCEYRLTKIIQNPSDTGTYYCAVVTCGEILFGKGTKVETRGQEWSNIMLGGVLACSLLANFTLIFTRRKEMKLDENKAVAVKLHNSRGQNREQRNEDRMMYSTAIFTMIKTNHIETPKVAKRRMTFAAAKPFGL